MEYGTMIFSVLEAKRSKTDSVYQIAYPLIHIKGYVEVTLVSSFWGLLQIKGYVARACGNFLLSGRFWGSRGCYIVFDVAPRVNNIRLSGSKYPTCIGFEDQKPQILGTWTPVGESDHEITTFAWSLFILGIESLGKGSRPTQGEPTQRVIGNIFASSRLRQKLTHHCRHQHY